MRPLTIDTIATAAKQQLQNPPQCLHDNLCVPRSRMLLNRAQDGD